MSNRIRLVQSVIIAQVDFICRQSQRIEVTVRCYDSATVLFMDTAA